MKFRDGYMIKAGNPTTNYVDKAARHVLLRQGVLGLSVKIMLPHDPSGRIGPKIAQPDVVKVFDPKEEEHHVAPHGAAAKAPGYGVPAAAAAAAAAPKP
jgi:small subunit ribosomal protein S3e